jgi:hypothetical protein
MLDNSCKVVLKVFLFQILSRNFMDKCVCTNILPCECGLPNSVTSISCLYHASNMFGQSRIPFTLDIPRDIVFSPFFFGFRVWKYFNKKGVPIF